MAKAEAKTVALFVGVPVGLIVLAMLLATRPAKAAEGERKKGISPPAPPPPPQETSPAAAAPPEQEIVSLPASPAKDPMPSQMRPPPRAKDPHGMPRRIVPEPRGAKLIYKKGMKGPHVRTWQRFLVQKKINIGSHCDDGDYGTMTAAATNAYQRRYRLPRSPSGSVLDSTIEHAYTQGLGHVSNQRRHGINVMRPPNATEKASYCQALRAVPVARPLRPPRQRRGGAGPYDSTRVYAGSLADGPPKGVTLPLGHFWKHMGGIPHPFIGPPIPPRWVAVPNQSSAGLPPGTQFTYDPNKRYYGSRQEGPPKT